MICERLRIFPTLLLFWIVLSAQGVCEAEIIGPTSPMITDVTPVSFSVVWATSEPATCGLNIFLDAEGTIPYDEAQVISESAEHFPAENIGVMKVRVVGLEQDSQYFFQTKTTFKKNSAISVYPQGPPFIGVKTETISIVVRNDVLAQQINTPKGRSELGTLLLADVDKASYPISGWARVGVPHDWAAIDANNFYDRETHLNLELEGGEAINLTLLGGGLCFVETQDIVPEENGEFQPLNVAATLPLSTCDHLLLKFMPWITDLLLLND